MTSLADVVESLAGHTEVIRSAHAEAKKFNSPSLPVLAWVRCGVNADEYSVMPFIEAEQYNELIGTLLDTIDDNLGASIEEARQRFIAEDHDNNPFIIVIITRGDTVHEVAAIALITTTGYTSHNISRIDVRNN